MVSVIANLQFSEIKFFPTDIHLSYLPLAHIFEKVVSCCILYSGGKIGIYSGDVLKLKDDLADLKPTVFPSVPRLYSRFHDIMTSNINK